jgi:hypothetical protein
MAAAEAQPHDQTSRPNLGFVVGEWEGILPPSDIKDLKDLSDELAGGKDRTLMSAEDRTEIAILGADLAIAALIEKQSAQSDAAIRDNVAASRELTAPFKPEIEERRPKAGPKSANYAHRRRRRQSVASIGHITSEVAHTGGWQRFHNGDLILNPELHERDGGIMDLHLSSKNMLAQTGGEEVKIAYRTQARGREAVFSGLLVPAELRGRRLGRDLFDYFLQGLQKQGVRFGGTDRIHKPEVALMLMEAGLVPEHRDIMAAVLPRESGGSKAEAPRVVIMRARGHLGDMVTQSGAGTHSFYSRLDAMPKGVDPEQAKVVPLHTRWHMPEKP